MASAVGWPCLGADDAAAGFARLRRPVDEAGVGSRGARIAGAGTLACGWGAARRTGGGTSGISRLPGGRNRRGRRGAVPVRWRAKTAAPRYTIVMLAGAEASMEDPGAAEGAACQRGSSGSTHSRSSFAACPARMWGDDDVQLADDGGCSGAPDADQAGAFCLGQSMLDTRGTRLSRSWARRARVAPWARAGGHHAPAGHDRMIGNSQPGLITVPGPRAAPDVSGGTLSALDD